MDKLKVLFILKFNNDYGCYSYSKTSSGLLNSALFVSEMLNKSGVDSKTVQVLDNNAIDREVNKFKPNIVIIEALWVVPEKFEILKKLHPSVTWLVRIHSNIPFLAQEGIAIDWIKKYVSNGIFVGANSLEAVNDLKIFVLNPDKVLYLPNYYPIEEVEKTSECRDFLNIGCFGAVRPLKNQLSQAIAAINFSEQLGVKFKFHINGTRCELGGENILKNLRYLLPDNLVEHPWETHDAFLKVLSNMDLSLCVSLSETFSITAADSVVAGVPLVTSSQVFWASNFTKADPTNVEDIVDKMRIALDWPILNKLNVINLKRFDRKSKKIWLDTLVNLW